MINIPIALLPSRAILTYAHARSNVFCCNCDGTCRTGPHLGAQEPMAPVEADTCE